MTFSPHRAMKEDRRSEERLEKETEPGEAALVPIPAVLAAKKNPQTLKRS